MDFRRFKISSVLITIALLLSSALLSACFEIPSEPIPPKAVKKIEVKVIQEGNPDSSSFKVKPKSQVELYAKVTPKSNSDDLTYNWKFSQEDGSEASIFSGNPYKTTTSYLKQLPNKLVVTDAEGNQIVKTFDIVINSPPTITNILSPKQNTILVGNEKTAFKFDWIVTDENDTNLSSTVLWDGVPQNVYKLNQVWQSGFSSGKHTFQVIVEDSYGDTDTSEVINFRVYNPEAGEK